MANAASRKPRNVTLTDAKIRATKPDPERAFKLSDSGSLYLLIQPNGSRLWRWKYYWGEKEKLLALGKYPSVSLKEARRRRDEARELSDKGIDPGAHRKAQKAAKRAEQNRATFKSVADKLVSHEAATTSETTQHKKNWELAWLKPLHRRRIDAITTEDVVKVVKNIELSIQRDKNMPRDAGVDTAHRAAGLARRIFDYANNSGVLTDGRNPAATVSKVLLPVRTKHHAALIDPVEVGQLLDAIWSYQGSSPVVEFALRIAPYIFVRPFEQRHLRWEWIDGKDKSITIPKEFMKGRGTENRIDHFVPLAPQVVDMLRALRKVTGDGDYIFPGVTRSKAMSENALTTALRRLGYTGDQQTWHGFRTTASTLLNEMGYSPDLIESQLAHKLPGGGVRDAYNRAEYREQRRGMMVAYADYLDELRERYWMG